MLNQDPVCYGTRGDNPGVFHLKDNLPIKSIKLQHLSGYVKCCPEFPRVYWGCSNNVNSGSLMTVITNATRTPLFPVTYSQNNKFWQMEGYTISSNEIVLVHGSKDYQGYAGEPLHIWFGEDLLDYYDEDNSGEHCVNVYAIY